MDVRPKSRVTPRQAGDNNVLLARVQSMPGRTVEAPFHPEAAYPEYRGGEVSEWNPVYAAVRDLLRGAGYDSARFGTTAWNPLREVIKPGDAVLIKPNLVFHRSHAQNEDYYSVVTHPAIIRAIVDYVALALGDKGKITIGDAPLNNADFGTLVEQMGLAQIASLHRRNGLNVTIVDFRMQTMEKDERGVMSNVRRRLDPDEIVSVKLDGDSQLSAYDGQYAKFRVTEYDGRTMPLYHREHLHQYGFHRSVLEADVIISLPKIKTHRKAGFTCAMKNFVGVNANKDWLPHHRKGSAQRGGDEYQYASMRKALISWSWDTRWRITSPFLQRALLLIEHLLARTKSIIAYRDDYTEGSWWGNTTISKTIVDLNQAVLYSDRSGKLAREPQRRLLFLVDGIVCGEGEGPMAATAKRCDLLLWGTNAYVVDLAVTRFMGFEPAKIDVLRTASSLRALPLFRGAEEDIRVYEAGKDEPMTLHALAQIMRHHFVPSSGWKGHIEAEENRNL